MNHSHIIKGRIANLYSHKFKGPGVRYLVGVSIRSSEIVFVKGPLPCGSWPDINIFRNWLHDRVLANERVIADQGFRGEPTTVLWYNPAVNSARLGALIGSILGRHESVNKRFKQFGCMKKKFRQSALEHKDFFDAVAVFTQQAIKK